MHFEKLLTRLVCSVRVRTHRTIVLRDDVATRKIISRDEELNVKLLSIWLEKCKYYWTTLKITYSFILNSCAHIGMLILIFNTLIATCTQFGSKPYIWFCIYMSIFPGIYNIIPMYVYIHSCILYRLYSRDVTWNINILLIMILSLVLFYED